MEKLFHKLSEKHGGMKAGTKVRLLKDHHEIGGSVTAGSECVVDAIIHYPTRYRLHDDAGKIWTVPIHSVELVTADTEETAAEDKGEADQIGK
ncbi:MAG: hypothetical protein CMG29_01820 [Candidatus Marinimicrobia bacterium]|jgi:hypothetical protein|nr:hypothetical protein [Candidatus Neomarinimicrobiota bacterium]|tara:strand:+ start:666 stop:944 length:279 start_codon:yes stop_codon:yes gene_type:complete